MQVIEWKDKLMVRLPENLIKSLELKPGDELDVVTADCTFIAVAKTDSSSENMPLSELSSVHGKILTIMFLIDRKPIIDDCFH